MRPIDADALYKVFREELERYPMPETPGLGRYRAQVWREAAGFFITMLMKTPTIDAKPVRHGRWVGEKCNHKPYRIKNPEKWVTYKCSVCEYSNGRKQSNYCPNCGAKMDGGGDE